MGLYTLSLCSGIGALDLGFKIAVPHSRTICYVEREAYAIAVLAAHIENKSLDEAPIWTDLTTFDGKPWRGVVDCIIAGIPCQPYSLAGERMGDEDERAIWPELVRIIGETNPALVFLENVAGQLQLFRPIGEALSELGFEFEGGLYSASEVGATHQRERLFILAASIFAGKRFLANSNGKGLENRKEQESLGGNSSTKRDRPSLFPPRPIDPQWGTILKQYPESAPAVEFDFRRMDDGTPNRVDRLRALGNTVVPLQAAYAFTALASRERFGNYF